eukprot:9926917-Ditylum_brightwellii.AAC.1
MQGINTIIKNQYEFKRAQDWKEAGDSNSRPKGANKHNIQQSNGSHHSMTYCCYGKSNTSGCDSYCSHQDNSQHSSGRHCNDDCQNNYSGRDCNNDHHSSSYANKVCHRNICDNHCNKGGQESHSLDDKQKGDRHRTGNQGQSHHMKEKCSHSCSQSKSCSRSCSHSSSCSHFSSQSCSYSCSLSKDSKQNYDNYHVEDPNMDLDEGE